MKKKPRPVPGLFARVLVCSCKVFDMPLSDTLRIEAVNAPESGIVAVMNHGRRVGGVLPLWAGEGDLPTPDFIRSAAVEAIDAGETFYTWQRGIPELRDALARYHNRH